MKAIWAPKSLCSGKSPGKLALKCYLSEKFLLCCHLTFKVHYSYKYYPSSAITRIFLIISYQFKDLLKSSIPSSSKYRCFGSVNIHLESGICGECLDSLECSCSATDLRSNSS